MFEPFRDRIVASMQVRTGKVERNEHERPVGVLEGTLKRHGVINADPTAAGNGPYVVAMAGEVSLDLTPGLARRADDDVRAALTQLVVLHPWCTVCTRAMIASHHRCLLRSVTTMPGDDR
ncbi:hypothetical protein Airi01_043070 [Actinoallomurus iriomotensis]|uniref:Uncharacterized protein n=1 Tax=Actinoallomurus iriomotensis TaxID=478107 RepID=A0A9W6VPT9_9ACTN|nr:hypothetical protein Airi01_043070 [Actinoallomurus iriomotensis]